MGQRIFVTGVGAVGPFGSGAGQLWDAVVAGQPLWRECSRYTSPFPCAEAYDFRLADHVKNPRAARSPLISQYALATAAQAVENAQLNLKRHYPERSAIVYGTGNGPAEATERSLDAIINGGMATVEPLVFQESVFNAPASLVSIHFGVRGPLLVVPVGWAAGGFALKAAVNLLQKEDIDCVLVIAAEELAGATHAALGYLGLVAPNDGQAPAMRPLDRRRNGAVLAEGAVTLVLETESGARSREAPVRAELAGCATTSDAAGAGSNDATGAALERSMRLALARAGSAPTAVDWVVSGSFATVRADQLEAAAIRQLFGEGGVPVSSIKPVVGEAMGVAGLLNAVAGLQAMAHGEVPANGVATQPESDSGLDLVTEPRTGQPIKTVLVNTFWVSGAYASAVLRSVP